MPSAVPASGAASSASTSASDRILGKRGARFGESSLSVGSAFILRSRRHQPLLRALAENAQHASVEVHFEHLQPDQFRDAQAGGVEHFEHGAVAHAERRVRIRRREQRLDVGL